MILALMPQSLLFDILANAYVLITNVRTEYHV